MPTVLSQFKDIHTFIFDVDGVLTNSQLLLTEKGELLRSVSTRDGYAIRRALQQGYRVAIITGGKSQGVISRFQKLGIVDIYAGIQHKVDAFEEYLLTYDLDPAGILFMGDDFPDYEVLQKVGLPTCPNDAIPEIQAICQYISPIKGGGGCARDVIEKVLKLNEKWVS